MNKILSHPIFLLLGLMMPVACGGPTGSGLTTNDQSGAGNVTIAGNPTSSKYTITGSLALVADKQSSSEDECAPQDADFTVVAVDAGGQETSSEAIRTGQTFSITVDTGSYQIKLKQNGNYRGDLYNPPSHTMAGLFGVINLSDANIDVGNVSYTGFCHYSAEKIPDMRDSDYNFNGLADSYEGFLLEMPCTFCIESVVPFNILFVQTMPTDPSKYRGTAIFRLNDPVATTDSTKFQVLDESGAVVIPELDPAQVQIIADAEGQGIVQAHFGNLDLFQNYTLKVDKDAFTSTTGEKTGQVVSVNFRTVPAL